MRVDGREMDCKRADESLVDLLYEELPAEGRRALEAHLEGCPRCAGELARLRGVLRLVREQPLGEPSAEVGARILHLARAARDAAPARAQAGFWWRRAWSPALVAVMLGLVVVAVGLVAYQGMQPAAPGPDAPGLWGQEERALPAAAPVVPSPVVAEQPPARSRPEAAAGAEGSGALGLDPAHFVHGDDRVAGLEAGAPLPPRREKRPGPVAKPAPAATREAAPAKPASAFKQKAGPGSGDARRDGLLGTDKDLDEAQARPKVVGGADAEDAEDERFARPPPAPDAPALRTAVAQVEEAEVRAGEAKKEQARPREAPPAAEKSAPADEATRDLAVADSVAAEPASVAPAAAAPAGRRAARGGGGAAEDLLARGERLLAAGDAAGAAEALGAFLRERPGDPRSPVARFRHARALFLSGRCAEAVAATRQALSARPAHPAAGEALLDQASCEVRLGRFEDARRTYQRVEREHPELADEARRGLERLPR